MRTLDSRLDERKILQGIFLIVNKQIWKVMTFLLNMYENPDLGGNHH